MHSFDEDFGHVTPKPANRSYFNVNSLYGEALQCRLSEIVHLQFSFIHYSEGPVILVRACRRFAFSIPARLQFSLSIQLIKPNFGIPFPHRRSTTVSLEANHFIHCEGRRLVIPVFMFV